MLRVDILCLHHIKIQRKINESVEFNLIFQTLFKLAKKPLAIIKYNGRAV